MSARRYTAVTCSRARRMVGSAPRHYGYTILVDPPEEFTTNGEDIEGIGWVPHRGGPQKHIVKWKGWYKHRDMAEQRAKEYNSR